MDPYYTLSNLFLYTLSIILLGLLVPALVYVKEYQSSKALIVFLGFFAGLFIFWPLSETCPYPKVKTALLILTVICICGILLSGLLTIIDKFKGNELIPFTKKKAHRWIMEALEGHYLITSPSGHILSCGKTVLSPLEPYHDETLNSFLKRAGSETADSFDNREALKSLRHSLQENRDSYGNIGISNRHYRWTYHQLGDRDLQGYLLFLTDLTEEQRLIHQREETGRLLNLRNGRLKKQGLLALSLERSRLAEELSQKATKTIISHLILLTEKLRCLAETDTIDPKDINQAIIKSKEVMAQIREAVHTLPYTMEKEKS